MVAASELMQRYCNGDAQAFRELHARVAPALRRYLMRLGSDRPLAEDLLQETFLKIHRARRAYVAGADPVPWMYAIAHRTFLDEMRARRRTPPRSGDEPPADDDHDHDHDRRELARAARAALDTLPPQQRHAVILIKLEGRTLAEAAAIAGTTVGAMKLRAHRGYEALRKLFAAR
jgi:RNA polymerase sigma-70 factor, ECF subfamily